MDNMCNDDIGLREHPFVALVYGKTWRYRFKSVRENCVFLYNG